MMIKTIGVEQKRHVKKGVASSDLCFKAADALLESLAWQRDEVDLLVFVSQTGDYHMPATACILQERLGLSKQCMALDVNMGCSGYVYGLSVVSGLVSSGRLKKALLLAGEVPSPNSSYTDKSVYPLFGDAGTATAIELQESWPSSYFNLQTDGAGYDAIMIPDGGMRNYIDPVSSFAMEQIMEGIERNRTQISLDGMKVFNFTLQEVRPNVRRTL
jgi:3-oxoacyl-[acyl-carrier-protein] synthase-3